MDEDTFTKDDWLGSHTITLSSAADCNPNPYWVSLDKAGKPFGRLQLQMTLRPPAGMAPALAPRPVAVAQPVYGAPSVVVQPQPIYHQQPAVVITHQQPQYRVNKKGKRKQLKFKKGKWTSSSSDSLSDILKKGFKKLF